MKEGKNIKKQKFSKRNKNKKKKFRLNYKIKIFMLYFTALSVIIGVSVCVSFTVLFKIDTINVNGKSRYDESEIVKLSEIKRGENLFLLNSNEKEERILNSMPYLKTVEIEKKIPNQVDINIVEDRPEAQLEYNGSYIILDDSNKVMDLVKEPLEGVRKIIIRTDYIEEPVLGCELKFQDENVGTVLKLVLVDLNNFEIKKVNMIDFSNPVHILLSYEDRITIELGSPEDIDYKLKLAANIIKNELKENDRGKLNLSLSAQNNKTYFTPEHIS